MVKTGLATTLIGSAILLMPALIDGAPLFYFDSAAHIKISAKAVTKLQPYLEAENAAVPVVKKIGELRTAANRKTVST